MGESLRQKHQHPTSPTTQAQVTYVSESVSYSKFDAKDLSLTWKRKVEAILKSAWTEKDQIDNFLKERRILKDGGEDFCYSDTERLSRSDEVLKLKNFKKDATLKISKSTNQEWYEHVGPEVTSYTRWQDSLR
ncbi:hypothetical protein Tco_0233846 [Tanacetum coccineum]